MKMAAYRVVKRTSADGWREGEEQVRQYITTERINFATSSLAPGAMSSLDDGHPGAEEICYVISGTLNVIFPARMDEVRLGPGDMVLIMPDEPHQLHNRGQEPVQMVWCAAPGKQLMELVQRLRTQGRR
jgi:mannose-6-phosphate isomerase-like protein (cupin superfamily)